MVNEDLYLFMYPKSILFVVGTWIVMLLTTGLVGLSTIIACFVLVICSFYSGISFIVFSIIAFIFILFTHRSNIRRMIRGEENQFKKIMIFKRKQK